MFYDGQEFTVAAADLAYANGINISRDGTVLYVAETVGEKIALFTRNTDTNELMFQQSLDMDSGIDNIELDSKGNLWIGSHPKLLTFTRHAKNAEKLSPSQVLKYQLWKIINMRLKKYILILVMNSLGQMLLQSTRIRY